MRHAWAEAHHARGTQVVCTPSRVERVRRPPAALRNRVETTIGELTEYVGLARHRARTVRGVLTCTASTLLAHTLHRLSWA